MKQFIVQKHPLLKSLAGNTIDFHANIPDGETIELTGGNVTTLRIPFPVKVLSGGELNFTFHISKALAESGVTLLGAYWENNEVTACLMPIQGFNVLLDNKLTILVGTLIAPASYRQATTEMAGNVVQVDSNKNTSAIQLAPKPEPKKRRRAPTAKRKK